MRMVPDLNRMGWVLDYWRIGMVNNKDAVEELTKLFEPDQLIPEPELVRQPDTDMVNRQILTQCYRFQYKLNVIMKHLNVPLPDDLNPNILGAEARELADRGEKISAIKAHRDATGTGLAHAKQLIDDYMRQRRGDDKAG